MRKLAVLILLILLAGCSQGGIPAAAPEITPQLVTVVVTEYVTVTPEPTPSPAITATPTPTATPEPVDNPLEITKVRMSKNSIGTPEVYVDVKNNGTINVDAYDFVLKGYNAYGEQLKNYTNNYFAGTMQEMTIKPGGTSRSDWRWSLYGMDTARTVSVALERVLLSDGTIINILEDQYIWVDGELK